MKHLTRSFAQTVAAIAIALFWCISAVGTTVGTTLGVTTLATAINAVTSTPALARRYWRGLAWSALGPRVRLSRVWVRVPLLSSWLLRLRLSLLLQSPTLRHLVRLLKAVSVQP